MSDNNSAVIKIIGKKTKEYNDLLLEHNTLLEVHTKRTNDYLVLKEKMRDYLEDNADIEAKRYKLNRENKEYKKIIVQWEKENATLQESLDACQRELEKESDKVQELIDEMIRERDLEGG